MALILVDYPQQARLKILGRVEIVKGAEAERLGVSGYAGVIGRGMLIRIEAFDWNCQQHITPR